MLFVDEVESEVGSWRVATGNGAVVALGATAGFEALLRRRMPAAGIQAIRTEEGERLRAYFAGDLHALDDVRLDPGGTPFQRSVWDLVRAIPAGQTRTYGELARALGKAGASRAVGAANGRNPVALAIPCHRVVSPTGLRGYAWGLHAKEWLLAHERA